MQRYSLYIISLVVGIICLYSLYVIQHYKDNIEIRFNQKFFIISFIVIAFYYIRSACFYPLLNYLVSVNSLKVTISMIVEGILAFYVLCSYKKYIQIKEDTKDTLLIILLATDTLFFPYLVYFDISEAVLHGLLNVVNTIIGIYIIYKYRSDFFKMLKSFTNNKV